MKPSHFLLALACFVSLAPASAQWAWRNSSGSLVFSDRPPPPDVPVRNIVKQPGGIARQAELGETATTAQAPASAASSPASAASASPATKAEADDKKKADAEKALEAAKQKAEADKLAKTRAENCARAVQAKTTYESGVRVARANAQGQREFLDDAGRAAELKRIQGVIATDCK